MLLLSKERAIKNFCFEKIESFLKRLTLLSFLTLSSAMCSEAKSDDLTETDSKTIRILSIDGGGMRGIIPATIIDYISRKLGKEPSELFHLIGGTSIGAVISGLLTMPANSCDESEKWVNKYKTTELLKNIINEKGNIFRKRHTFLPNLFGPLYDMGSLNNVADRFYGKTTFNKVLVPTVTVATDFYTEKSKIIKSWDSQEIYYTKDAVLASAAAPYFFSPHTLSPVNTKTDYKTYTMIDGGVKANNPTAHLVKVASEIYPQAQRIAIFSVGTGLCEEGLIKSTLRTVGKFIRLRDDIVDLYLEDQITVTEKYVDMIHKGPYWRLNPLISSSHVGIDNIQDQNISYLQQTTLDYLEANYDYAVKPMLDYLSHPKSVLVPELKA